MDFEGFDWDAGNREKCCKHGVSVQEIEEVLLGHPIFAPDRAHSSPAEQRFIAVGRTAGGRAMFVAFTVRLKGGRKLARPVSARYMHKKEADRYARQTSN